MCAPLLRSDRRHGGAGWTRRGGGQSQRCPRRADVTDRTRVLRNLSGFVGPRQHFPGTVGRLRLEQKRLAALDRGFMRIAALEAENVKRLPGGVRVTAAFGRLAPAAVR